jgi:hypothetical protein
MSSETLVNIYQTTRRNNPEDRNLQTYRRENPNPIGFISIYNFCFKTGLLR